MQSNNGNVMMNDLSARNVIEKFTVFETGPKSFSRKTSGSLHGARSFPITRQAVQFSHQNPYPDIFQSVPAKEIFLLVREEDGIMTSYLCNNLIDYQYLNFKFN